MKKNFTFILFLLSIVIFAQDITLTDSEIKLKLDSIKQEGDLLFSLENASWHSTDLKKTNKKIKNFAGEYLTYKSNDTIKTVFFNKTGNKVIAEYYFLNNYKKPVDQLFEERNLKNSEHLLKNVRDKINPQLSDPKYQVAAPSGFNLNMIVIPFNDKYKTYLITGASEANVIPFGNDYLFISDKDGKILENKKFHSRLIPTFTSMENGGNITMSTHSHLKTSPFISATDICTFKLYAPFTKLEKFSVYSPALKTYFQYDIKKDIIEKVKSPN